MLVGGMYQSAWAAITKYHRRLLLIVLWDGKSKIRVQHGQILVRTLLLGYRWLPSCCVGETASSGLFISLYKGTDFNMGTPSSGPKLNLIIFQRPHFKYHHNGRIKTSTYELGGHKYSVFSKRRGSKA